MLRRAATYARFSTDLQRDASITDQQALCRRYAERNGLEIVRGYSDSAKSGGSLAWWDFRRLSQHGRLLV